MGIFWGGTLGGTLFKAKLTIWWRSTLQDPGSVQQLIAFKGDFRLAAHKVPMLAEALSGVAVFWAKDGERWC